MSDPKETENTEPVQPSKKRRKAEAEALENETDFPTDEISFEFEVEPEPEHENPEDVDFNLDLSDFELEQEDTEAEAPSTSPSTTPQTVNAESKNSFKCTECPKTFKNRIGLGLHIKWHQGTLLPCPYCKVTARGESYLKKHIARFHERQACTRPYTCPISGCTSNFKSRPNLVSHLGKCHKGLDSKALRTPFNCSICPNKAFSDQELLDRHNLSHHTTYRCDLCDKTFPNRYLIKYLHIRVFSSYSFQDF